MLVCQGWVQLPKAAGKQRMVYAVVQQTAGCRFVRAPTPSVAAICNAHISDRAGQQAGVQGGKQMLLPASAKLPAETDLT